LQLAALPRREKSKAGRCQELLLWIAVRVQKKTARMSDSRSQINSVLWKCACGGLPKIAGELRNKPPKNGKIPQATSGIER
jgi:hypothetical protein